MTYDNAKEFLPLVQALIERKTIQGRDGAGGWRDLPNPAFDESRDFYRVKPEPRRFWVNIYPGSFNGISLWLSKSEADKCACSHRTECIEVVEVLK